MNKVYEIITDRIIAQLEKGNIPWHKPWQAGGVPKNLITKKAYRGINVFLLCAQGYASPYWLTFKQCQELGGHVRKGEKSTPVVFWKFQEVQKENQETGEIETVEKFPMLRYYNVFNVSQCEEIPEHKIPQPVQSDNSPIALCEEIVTGYKNKPEIIHGQDQASYSPTLDRVRMPNLELFDSSEAYYSTLFHELTHSTGHTDRLNRQEVTTLCPFGSTNYSKEELVAEFGASYLCGMVGIVNSTIDNSAAYIQGWLKELRNNKKLALFAAAQAQKAVDYILGE